MLRSLISVGMLFFVLDASGEKLCGRLEVTQDYRDLNRILDCLERQIESIRESSSAEIKPTQTSPDDTPVPSQPKSSAAWQQPESPLEQPFGDVKVSILKIERRGTAVIVHLRFINTGNADLRPTFFGKGSYYGGSLLFAKGKRVDASEVSVGGQSSRSALRVGFPPSIYVEGYVKFDGIDLDTKAIELLDVYYSNNNARPSGAVRFRNVPVN